MGTYGYQGFCMFWPINSSWKFRNQSKKICRKLSWDVLCLVRLWRWILYRTSSRFSRRCWWELQVPTNLGGMNISPSYAIAMYWQCIDESQGIPWLSSPRMTQLAAPGQHKNSAEIRRWQRPERGHGGPTSEQSLAELSRALIHLIPHRFVLKFGGPSS